MRKISANLILPVSLPPLINGIIRLDDRGTILEVTDTGGRLREESGLEFYSGIILPGFVLPWLKLEEVAESIGGLDRELIRSGVRGTGVVIRQSNLTEDGLEQMHGSPITYHPVIEVCPEPGEDEFDVFNRGVDWVSHAWNEFNLFCSLISCSRAAKYSDINRYIREYNAAHQHVVPPEHPIEMFPGRAAMKDTLTPGKKSTSTVPSSIPGKFPSSIPGKVPSSIPGKFPSSIPGKGSLNILEVLQASGPGKDFGELLPAFTLEAAARIFEDDLLGSIETGKRPGLNLVSGIDTHSLRPNDKTSLRVLV